MRSSLLLSQLKHPEQYGKTEGTHLHQAQAQAVAFDL